MAVAPAGEQVATGTDDTSGEAGERSRVAAAGTLVDIVQIDVSGRRAGMEGMMLGVTAHAVAAGKSVLVVVPSDEALDSLVDDAHAVGAAVVRVEPLHTETRRGVRERWRVGAAVYRTVRSARPAVVHIHVPWVPMCTEAIVASRLAGARSIVRTEHNPVLFPLSRLQRWKLAASDLLVDRFVFVSQGNLRSHVENTARSGARCIVIPNGVEASAARKLGEAERDALRRSLGFDGDGPICVMVGVLEERKGVLEFVRAAAVASSLAPELRFAVVGDGPLREAAEALAAEHQLDHRVRFLGRRDDVLGILPAFDFFVQPSLFEGLSIAMLEALAAGLPMVTTDVDGVDEVFPDGLDLITVAVGDTAALGRGMAKLATDAGLRQQLATASVARIEAGFTLSAMASSYERLYEEMATDPGFPHRRLFGGRLGRLPRATR